MKPLPPRAWAAAAATAAAVLAACGGGNPLSNPSTVTNGEITGGQKLSFAYFQRCINPIFLAQLRINQNGQISTNTCSSTGCHDNVAGTGGALRLVPGAAVVNLDDTANTPEAIRATDMYKNFYSAQGSTIPGAPTQSRLLLKPLVQNVLHGGGLIFESANDENARRIAYWITHPAPAGQDEFSRTTDTLFEPANPMSGNCKTE